MRNWLISKRKELELTQKEVASKCGVSRQYYCFIESGKRNAPVSTAKKIASALGFDWKLFYADETGEG